MAWPVGLWIGPATDDLTAMPGPFIAARGVPCNGSRSMLEVMPDCIDHGLRHSASVLVPSRTGRPVKNNYSLFSALIFQPNSLDKDSASRFVLTERSAGEMWNQSVYSAAG